MGGSFLYDERGIYWLSGLGKRHASEVASVTICHALRKAVRKSKDAPSYDFMFKASRFINKTITNVPVYTNSIVGHKGIKWTDTRDKSLVHH